MVLELVGGVNYLFPKGIDQFQGLCRAIGQSMQIALNEIISREFPCTFMTFSTYYQIVCLCSERSVVLYFYIAVLCI